MKKITAWLLAAVLGAASLCSCGSGGKIVASDRTSISAQCNMSQRTDLVWNYQSESDTWLMSPATTVANPEDPAKQSISICIPGAYVSGIDTNGDGEPDQTSENTTSAVTGQLLILGGSVVVSSTGVEYHSGNAPILLMNSSVYGEATDTALATAQYASEGYITVSCGNRGTSPKGVVDLKNDVLFLKFNIASGNLPGSYHEIIATGGMLAILTAATGHNKDFYSEQADAGAFGIYRAENGAFTFYSDEFPSYMITDRVWGCLATDAVCSLYTETVFSAMERVMDPDTVYESEAQKVLDTYLAQAGAQYLTDQKTACSETELGYDLNGNGELEDKIYLVLRQGTNTSAGLNGYIGSYLNYYLLILNEAQNLPTEDEKAAAEAVLAIENMSPISPETLSGDLSYEELLKQYQEELRDLYREKEAEVYAYNPLGYIEEADVYAPSWVRFVENPVTSDHSIFGPLSLTAAWDASATDTDIRYVWDTDLSDSDLERKYYPAIIDEMVQTMQIEEFATAPNLSSVADPEIRPEDDRAADILEGDFAVTLQDAIRYENVPMTNLPLTDDEQQKTIRQILTGEEDGTYYDVFVLKGLEEENQKLKSLWK